MKDKIVLSNPRIVWVDYYKVIGIFLIVLGHSIFRNSDLTKFLYIFHVPIFFFISGYLEKNNPCPTKKYLKKLLYSLIIPYFIWNILYFPFHLSFRSVIAMVVGLPPWNGASWFLMVLVFIKLNALFYKNKKYVVGVLLSLGFFSLQLYGRNLPYYINLTFMFSPFFFAGMYGKDLINKVADTLKGKTILKLFFSLVLFILLLLVYRYTPIAHTNAVVSFLPKFYLYWLSGFIGIFALFFICLCFKKESKVITTISISTLFVMCSHYELLMYITPIITQNYGDIVTFIFVFLFFALQCVLAPWVLKHFPILLGKKRNNRRLQVNRRFATD